MTHVMTSQPVEILQSLLLPDRKLCSERELYIRTGGPVGLSDTKQDIHLSIGGTLSTNTYFNVFPIEHWLTYAQIDNIALSVKGKGLIEISVFHAMPNKSWDRLITEMVQLKSGQLCTFDVSHFSERTRKGFLFVEIKALELVTISNLDWVTHQKAITPCEMALVLTTFNRTSYVKDTIVRLSSVLGLSSGIHCFVIDNAQSLCVENSEFITCIPNENLGGSGGYARGLIEAKQRGFSHCIFMDDDAFIHPESIRRVHQLFRFSSQPPPAIAGALSNAAHRWQMYENGAFFNGVCTGLDRGVDLREPATVAALTFDTDKLLQIGYGAWWFFAFEISQCRQMPFPFFVRGDDVSFSHHNDFEIITLPGVMSFQDMDFSEKTSPWTLYLDLRSHLVHLLLDPVKKKSFFSIIKTALYFPLRSLFLHQYDSTRAMILAIEHVRLGPSFFDKDADVSLSKSLVANIWENEKWEHVAKPVDLHFDRLPTKLGFWIARFTFNGLLAPGFLLWGRSITIDKTERLNTHIQSNAAYVQLVDRDSDKVLNIRHSKLMQVYCLFSLIVAIAKFAVRIPKLRSIWPSGYAKMTSTEYWKSKLSLP